MQTYSNTNRVGGFSLVELVVVIVIIGLLAVTALPRFLQVTDEAKKASVEAIAGGFATGVLSARAQWEAEGRPSEIIDGQSYNVVDYDGVKLWLTSAKESQGNIEYRDGYPITVKFTDSSPIVVISDQNCVDLMVGLLQSSPPVAVSGSSNSNVRFWAQADNQNKQCVYTQNELGGEHKFVYQLQTGRVQVNLLQL